jgi:signal transduction histidine kinase
MRRGDITSGGAFTATFLSASVFIVILAALGSGFYILISSAMLRSLEGQITQETQLYSEIHQQDGLGALLDAISKVESSAAARGGVIGVFDQSGEKLAGNLTTPPAFSGWASLQLDELLPQPSGNFRVYANKLDGEKPVTLLVGQNLRLIETAQTVLIYGLLIAGGLVALLSVSVGYFISRQTHDKLQTVSQTLDDISRGVVSSRIPISAANDQIDRIARQVNTHLDRLAELTGTTKNTINAVAHDLRSPLNHASIMLQQLLAEPIEQAWIIARLDDLSAELAGLVDIFETILRISRIEATEVADQFAKIEVNHLMAEIAETYEPVLEASGQRLIIQPAYGLAPEIWGDRSMLFQLLANLIENIGKYTPAGSVATLSASPSMRGGCLLVIADNGPGIPVASHLDMLKPFRRMEESRSTPGNGLGLALVNAVIHHHRATLTMKDNAPGLRFEMLFPPVADELPKQTKK